MKNGHGNFQLASAFEWTEQRSKAALALAEGQTQREVSEALEISDRTIRNWNAEPEFAAEVDRLSLMVGVASRAERLRLAMRVVRQKTKGDTPQTDRDLLEWLKFAQSETDGIKLALTQLAALGEAEAPMAPRGSVRGEGEGQSETIN